MKKVFNQTLLIFAIIVATIYIDRNFLIPHDILKPQPVAMVGSGIQPMAKSSSILKGKHKIMLKTTKGAEFIEVNDWVLGEIKGDNILITTIQGRKFEVIQSSLQELREALEKFDQPLFSLKSYVINLEYVQRIERKDRSLNQNKRNYTYTVFMDNEQKFTLPKDKRKKFVDAVKAHFEIEPESEVGTLFDEVAP